MDHLAISLPDCKSVGNGFFTANDPPRLTDVFGYHATQLGLGACHIEDQVLQQYPSGLENTIASGLSDEDNAPSRLTHTHSETDSITGLHGESRSSLGELEQGASVIDSRAPNRRSHDVLNWFSAMTPDAEILRNGSQSPIVEAGNKPVSERTQPPRPAHVVSADLKSLESHDGGLERGTTQALSVSNLPVRPNIILFMTDDQGWGETGYYNNPYVHTPVLDQMASTGLRLDRAYSGGAVCSPTRASVMTGRNPTRSGVFSWNYSLRPEDITLPQIMRQGGYRTGHFGKWHLGAVKTSSPVDPGHMGAEEYLANDNYFDINPILSRNGRAPRQFTGESSRILVDKALGFIKKVHAEGKPFFTVIWVASPHSPYVATSKDYALYPSITDNALRNRLGEMTAVDRSLGVLRKGLRRLGVASNTVLWFNSDNGSDFLKRIQDAQQYDPNGGLRGGKGSFYEGGIRVPAVIEWPAVIRNKRITKLPIVTSDILPTVLDIAGLTSLIPDRPLDGVSLLNLIEGDKTITRPPIGFWKYPYSGEAMNGDWPGLDPEIQHYAIQSDHKSSQFYNYRHPMALKKNFGGEAVWMNGRFKLFLGRNDKGIYNVRLFNLKTNPSELESGNLAEQFPVKVRKMRRQLEAWQRSVEISLTGADYIPKAAQPNKP